MEDGIWHWSQTAMDVIRKQNEVEADMAKHFAALKALQVTVSEELYRRLATEGVVFVQSGEVVDVRDPTKP
jgi:hypothetical protein